MTLKLFLSFFLKKKFVHVLVEVQFLGYKFALKGLTYTRENTVYHGAFYSNQTPTISDIFMNFFVIPLEI